MTDSERARLVGRALLDDKFRTRLLEDPAGAARSLRIKLRAVEVARIQGLDRKELEQAAQQVKHLTGDDHHGLW